MTEPVDLVRAKIAEGLNSEIAKANYRKTAAQERVTEYTALVAQWTAKVAEETLVIQELEASRDRVNSGG